MKFLTVIALTISAMIFLTADGHSDKLNIARFINDEPNNIVQAFTDSLKNDSASVALKVLLRLVPDTEKGNYAKMIAKAEQDLSNETVLGKFVESQMMENACIAINSYCGTKLLFKFEKKPLVVRINFYHVKDQWLFNSIEVSDTIQNEMNQLLSVDHKNRL